MSSLAERIEAHRRLTEELKNAPVYSEKLKRLMGEIVPGDPRARRELYESFCGKAFKDSSISRLLDRIEAYARKHENGIQQDEAERVLSMTKRLRELCQNSADDAMAWIDAWGSLWLGRILWLDNDVVQGASLRVLAGDLFGDQGPRTKTKRAVIAHG